MKDAFPLPPMTNILDKLQKANCISTIDLNQAFYQIPLDEKSKEITTFTVTGRGFFRMTRMRFGLTNTPATLQRLIDKVISQELEPHAFVYLNDVIILSETFEEHLKSLKEVLDQLAAAGLSINPEKCLFFRSEIRNLGFLINNEVIKVDSSKLAAIFATKYSQAPKLPRLDRLVWALHTEFCDCSRAPCLIIEESAALRLEARAGGCISGD